VSFTAITLCVASERVFIVVSVYFFMDSVWKLLVTPSYRVPSITARILFYLTPHVAHRFGFHKKLGIS